MLELSIAFSRLGKMRYIELHGKPHVYSELD